MSNYSDYCFGFTTHLATISALSFAISLALSLCPRECKGPSSMAGASPVFPDLQRTATTEFWGSWVSPYECILQSLHERSVLWPLQTIWLGADEQVLYDKFTLASLSTSTLDIFLFQFPKVLSGDQWELLRAFLGVHELKVFFPNTKTSPFPFLNECTVEFFGGYMTCDDNISMMVYGICDCVFLF